MRRSEFKNGYQKAVRKTVKGPYKKLDVNWWSKQGSTLVDKTSKAGVKGWKWVRFMK